MTTPTYATAVHLDEDTVRQFEIPALLQQAGYTPTGTVVVSSVSYLDRSGQLVTVPTELMQMVDGDTLRISASGWADWFGSVNSFTLAVDNGTTVVLMQLQVVIDPVNDAPAGTDRGINLPNGSAYVLKEADFGFSDVADGHAFKSVLISDPPAVGELRLNGVRVTAGTEVRIEDVRAGLLTYVPPANVSGTAVFGFQVRDDGGTAGNGSVDLDPTPNYISFCIPNAVLGDRVWLDANGNGVQDLGEAGLAGVAVTVRGAGADGTFGTADDTSASTVTNANGNYQFTGLQAGRYQLSVGSAAAYVFTGRDLGSNDALDSDVDGNGSTQVFTLTAGQTNLTLDAGVRAVKASTLSGSSWVDANGNGVRDAGETGQAGVTVTVRGAGLDGQFNTADDTVATTVTGPGGGYSLGNLANGQYQVGFGAPAGYGFTGQDVGGNDAVDSDVNASGQSAVVTLGIGQGAVVDAGLRPLNTGHIGDRVWHDANGNGLQDAGEAGIGGIAITLQGAGQDNLFGTADDTAATTSSGASGAYGFNGLAAGRYQVVFGKQAGLVFTTRDVGTNDSIDSDANVTTGISQVVTLAANQTNVSVDAGYKQVMTASIGDKVWRDGNYDGVQQSTEAGMAGVSVQLRGAGLDNVFGTADDVAASTTTDVYGNYSFSALAAGRYTLSFGTTAGFTYTTQRAGTNAALDSDANAVTGQTDVFSLNAGQKLTSIDAGLAAIRTASIGDRVWLDANGNGRQDAGEAGVAGVRIQLSGAGADGMSGTADDVAVTTVSDANGAYRFNQLAAGSYTLRFDTPAGLRITGADAAPDNVDSDISGYGVANVTLATGQAADVDAGYQQVKESVLFGRVWNDLNSDGLYDASEASMPGVQVRLSGAGFDGVFGTADDVSQVTTTNSYGNYSFENLAGGNYVLGVEAPAAYEFTVKDALSNTRDTDDSDVNAATGRTDVFTLGSSTTRTDIAAGLSERAAASVGDRVWLDANGNGLQDAGEVGVAGVQVRLTGAGADGMLGTADDVVRTTTTNADGAYLISGLKSGTYTTTFTAPTGLQFTTANAGNDAIDSDVNATGAATVTLAPGQAGGVDAGLQQVKTSVVSGQAWSDRNGNGLSDAGEGGLAGVQVTLKGAGWDGVFGTADDVLRSTTTRADGSYSFTGLAAGAHTVTVAAPNSFVYTQRDALGNTQDDRDSDVDTTTGTTGVFTVATGATAANVSAGFNEVPGSSVGDRVWLDANGNGLQDAGEVGLAGLQVRLTARGADGVLGTADDVIRTTTTDASGAYRFDTLESGSYRVQVQAAGFKATLANAGDDLLDSDANSAGVATFTLRPGVADHSVDIGLQQIKTASVGDRVWADSNRNGLQDVDEAGQEGVTVVLRGAGFDNVFGTADDVSATTVSGADGSYAFTELAAGQYTLNFSRPGYEVTVANANGNTSDTLDSDIDAQGNTAVFTLGLGQVRTDIDAGLIPPPCASLVGDSQLYEGSVGSYRVQLNTAMAYDTVYYVSAAGGTAGRTLGWAGDQRIAAGGGTDAGGYHHYKQYYHNQYFDEYGNLCTATGPADMSWDYALYNPAGAIAGVAGGFYVTVKAGQTMSAAFSVEAWREKVYVDGDFLYGGYGFDDWCNVGRTDYQEAAVEWFQLNLTGVNTGAVEVCEPALSVCITDTSSYYRYSPIVLDMDGNGIQTTLLAESTGTFDLLGTGRALHSGWISSGDAFLAVDVNGNGRIDDISELFGGTKGQGFAKLASFDSNADGLVDAQDTAFSQLLLWQDADGNHATDAGELRTLAEAGIASLNTAYVDQAVEQWGNLLGEASTATRTDGSSIEMVDVYFNVAPDTAEGLAVAAGAPALDTLLSADDTLLDAALCGIGEPAAAAGAEAAGCEAWAEAGEATRQLIASMRLAESGLLASVG